MLPLLSKPTNRDAAGSVVAPHDIAPCWSWRTKTASPLTASAGLTKRAVPTEHGVSLQCNNYCGTLAGQSRTDGSYQFPECGIKQRHCKREAAKHNLLRCFACWLSRTKTETAENTDAAEVSAVTQSTRSSINWIITPRSVIFKINALTMAAWAEEPRDWCLL